MTCRSWPMVPVALALVPCACTGDPEPRAQLVVVVDTDLPTVEQASRAEELSAAGSIDSVRFDIFGQDLTPIASSTIVVPSPEDWPVSFGIEGGEVERVLVQARVFRSDLATPDGDTLVPEPALTVDRLLEVAVPREGIEVVGATLAAECLGVRPAFDPPRSCADATRPAQPALEAVERGGDLSRRPTRVGSAPLTREAPCLGPSPAGAVCVKGGFAHLGDARLVGAVDGILVVHDPRPLVPVHLSPFHLDVTEYTVARARAALLQDPSLLAAGDIVVRDSSNELWAKCTWLGVDDPGSDALPLVCVTFEGARRLCQHDGGDLPPESAWELAARGRGQQRPFAWGDSLPTCCLGHFEGCVDSPAPVASSGCGGASDTTRDGIADMTGNVNEMTLDSYVAYTSACWQQEGVLFDPVCNDASVESNTVRGANYTNDSPHPHLAIRTQGMNAVTLASRGFRCAYPDVWP